MDFLALFAKVTPYLVVLSRLPIEEYLIRSRPVKLVDVTPTSKEDPVAPPLDSPHALIKSDPVNLINGLPFPPDKETVSGVSQISAAGKACIPCGNDHFSTAASLLEEAMRFAREDHPPGEGGVYHPEVIIRISQAEGQLNAFERGDGSAEKVLKLPQKDMELMDEMLKASRNMRWMLKQIVDVPTLMQTTADMQRINLDFRTRVFDMQLNKLPEKTREIIKRTARELVQSVGEE